MLVSGEKIARMREVSLIISSPLYWIFNSERRNSTHAFHERGQTSIVLLSLSQNCSGSAQRYASFIFATFAWWTQERFTSASKPYPGCTGRDVYPVAASTSSITLASFFLSRSRCETYCLYSGCVESVMTREVRSVFPVRSPIQKMVPSTFCVNPCFMAIAGFASPKLISL